MIEVCCACLVEVDPDTKVCPICMEPVGTCMMDEETGEIIEEES